MIDYIGMGIFMRILREEWGYTREEVADMTGLCDKTIQNIEYGKSTAKMDNVFRLCDIYKVPLSEINYFYYRDDDMEYAIDLYARRTDRPQRPR